MEDLRQLFEQEMRALLEEGQAFATEFPEAARFLKVSGVDDRDPYVERMIEGVGFLTARVRELAEDSSSDLDRTTLDQLAPDLTQPLPSVSIVRFATLDSNQGIAEVPAGAMVRSDPVDGVPEGVPFRLLNPVSVTPAKVEHARLSELDKEGLLELALGWKALSGNHPWPDRLRFFLMGDAPVTWALHHALSHRLARAEIWRSGAWSQADLSIDTPRFSCYTTENDMALPLVEARDFLCSDERFRFVDICGLGRHPIPTKHPLRIRFQFRGPLPRGLARGIDASTFQLHAGVVVNRSREPLQGVTWDHARPEVPLRPLGGVHREICDVVSVRGFEMAPPGRQMVYRPYSSHAWNSQSGIYHISHRKGPTGRNQAFLGLSHPELGDELRVENIAIEAVCCDGELPNQRVSAQAVSESGSGVPEGIAIQGLVRPTPIHRMPEGNAALKSMLFSVARGHHNGWLEVEQLKDGLRHVLWERAQAKRTLIDAIQEVIVVDGRVQIAGVFWQRKEVEIRLRDTTCMPETWDRLGLLDAFGSVLWRFVRNQTQIGSRSLLRLRIEPAGALFEYGESP